MQELVQYFVKLAILLDTIF